MQNIQAQIDRSDATDLARLVRAGEVQPHELLEATIERLEQVNPALNAVAEKLYDQARQQTPVEGPFFGVPTLTKDLFAPLAEARMANGSLALGEARPGLDDELVGRWRRAGFVFVGTSTSPEFGTSYTTESTRFGATRNPWNTERSAGGSSGGAAALVASRVVPIAHGNDGGGSLRVPASCCGVFGFKPSRGLMPNGPLVGEGWGGMGTGHAISLSVRDSAALLDVTAGADLGAPYAAPSRPGSYVEAMQRPLKPLRIALVEQMAPWPSSPEALAAVRHAAKLCENLGHQVSPVTLPVDLPQFFAMAFDIIGPNTRNYVELLGAMRGAPVTEEELEPRTRIYLREKGDIGAVQYVQAIEGIHALGRTFANFMRDYDLILTPTLTREPPLIGTLDVVDDKADMGTLIECFHSYSPYTALFNATGQPAMSVPLYWSASGLPIGAHFAGRFGEESTLLALAHQLEQAQPWAQRRPPVNACMG
ncbi:amidase [Marinobacterium sp. D7]|uniref:amidase n=1 Tax=Marinobacterium ramblicola TaxID=2849041 RepID=UPI001C2DDE1E|nr:amidase family protein [Marinobacterium ramblicola]MBV1789942.1 amidase [Marinobacterium ramblicola]